MMVKRPHRLLHADENLLCPSWLPTRARILVKGHNDASIWGEARLGRRRLAQLTWTPEGKLLWERQCNARGQPHGLEIERDDSGRIVWTAQWVNGRMHGPVMQFDARGRPTMVTEFVRGTGTDIWMEGAKVAEIHEMVDGEQQGFVRWGNPRQPWCEERFFRGKLHGIWRNWDSDGTLKEGFPEFYVKGRKVSRARYDAAQARDESLPPYAAKDDNNRRPMPLVVREALARAKSLRRDLTFMRRLEERIRTRSSTAESPALGLSATKKHVPAKVSKRATRR